MISKCKENIQIYAEQKKNDRRQKVLVSGWTQSCRKVIIHEKLQ